MRFPVLHLQRKMSAPSLDFISSHPFVQRTVVDKVRGTIIGSALGDCIGLYTEFLPKTLSQELYPNGITLCEPITPFHGDGHRDKFSLGSWTDDSDHALALILSFLHHGRVDANDLAARIKTWAEQGLRCLDRLPLGLGATVGRVISRPDYTSAPDESAKRVWIKSGRVIAPNGSLMRNHPLGVICVGMTEAQAFELSMRVSMVTHYDPRCVVSCCVSTALIRGMLRGEVQTEAEIDRIITDAWNWITAQPSGIWGAHGLDPLHLSHAEFQKHTHAQTLSELQLDDSQKMGYVYKALGSGLLLLRLAMRTSNTTPDIFGTLMMDLIREGGDADTNGAVAGAFIGCWLGWSALTPRWRDEMHHRSWLLQKTDALCQTVGIVEGDYDGRRDADTAFDGGKGLLSRKQLEDREHAFIASVVIKMNDRKQKADKRKSSADKKNSRHSIWDRLK